VSPAARAARTIWSDYPAIRNIGFVGVLLIGAAAYGGEVQDIRSTPARVDALEQKADYLVRHARYLTCTQQDTSTDKAAVNNRCSHFLTEAP
jgi:hypothetical protein